MSGSISLSCGKVLRVYRILEALWDSCSRRAVEGLGRTVPNVRTLAERREVRGLAMLCNVS